MNKAKSFLWMPLAIGLAASLASGGKGDGGGNATTSIIESAGPKIDILISAVRGGTGGNSHAANEWYAIEGRGNQLGMASAEKIAVAALYTYAGLDGPIPTLAG